MELKWEMYWSIRKHLKKKGTRLLSLKFHWTSKVTFFIKDAQGNFRNMCKIIRLKDEASSFVCWHEHARGKVTKRKEQNSPSCQAHGQHTAWERSLKHAVNPLQHCQAISPCWSSCTKTLPPGPADTSAASWMTPELSCSHAISSSLHPCFAPHPNTEI